MAEELLLFGTVQRPPRRVRALELLATVLDGAPRSELELWELRDATADGDEGPLAAAATCGPGAGGTVRLVGVAVADGARGSGLGRRTVEELVDALRARGAEALAVAVRRDDERAIEVLRRGAFRPARAGPALAQDRRDLMWFDLEL